MSILSLTFHTPENDRQKWDHFMQTTLLKMTENLMDVEKYILSDVDSGMVNEGKNTNLLLLFENDEKRQDFVNIELINITEIIENQFGQNVMIFDTVLNPISSKF